MTWQLQEAKNKFSEVVEATLAQGPQIITRRGKNTVVVVRYADFQQLPSTLPTLKDLAKRYAGLDFPEIVRSKDIVGRATPYSLDDL